MTTPGDRLDPRDIVILTKVVQSALDARPPDAPDRARWQGLLDRLRSEGAARPPSLAGQIAKTLLDVATLSPDAAERSVAQLGEAMYRQGDMGAAPLLKRTATSIRNAKEDQAAHLRRGGGDGGDHEKDERMVDDRAILWHEPEAFSDPVVLDARMGPIISRLIAELRSARTFLELGIDAPTRVLFHGPPGVGKTLVARYIGAQLEVPVALMQVAGILIPYVGATEKNLRRAFDEVARRPGAIVFMDEIDGLSTRRDDDGPGASAGGKRITTVLLQLLDALPKEQVVIGATNFRSLVDPALARRLPTSIEFHYPDAEARGSMLAAWWKKLAVDDDARELLVAQTDGRSSDFLRSVSMSAARLALTDERVALKRVSLDHVIQALGEAPPPGELRIS